MAISEIIAGIKDNEDNANDVLWKYCYCNLKLSCGDREAVDNVDDCRGYGN